MLIDISGDVTKDWIDPEELRNGTGLVLMQDGSIQKDTICTYKYDIERSRRPRWPYRGTSTEIKLQEILLIQ